MKMKDSGIDWIGMVPEAWEVKRLKDLGSGPRNLFTDGDWINAEDISESGIRYFTSGNVGLGFFKEQGDGYISEEKFKHLNCLWVKSGDVMISRLNLPVGRSCIIPDGYEKCVVAVDCVILRCSELINKRYLVYFMSTTGYIKNAELYARGTTMQRITRTQLGNFKVCIPTLSEQKAIANYLDEKCGKIEEQVKLLEKKVEAYKNLKRSVINETVTRGLNKNVKLKDSGVDWIGMVPEGWEVTRIGSLYDNRSSKVSDRDYPPLSVSKKGIVPQMESVAKTDNNDDRKMVCVGDFVINSRSDRRGACGISMYNGSVSVINIVLKPQRNMCSKYYNWLFRTTFFADEFYNHGHGIVDDLWSTKWSDMKDIEVISPPLSEQQAIANYLDEKCSKIDKAIELVEKQIDAYKRLKRSLINEVVTGKRRVE